MHEHFLLKIFQQKAAGKPAAFLFPVCLRLTGARNRRKERKRVGIETYIRELREKVRSDRIASIEEVLETFTRIIRREEKENIKQEKL